jgi:hypothetical protein
MLNYLMINGLLSLMMIIYIRAWLMRQSQRRWWQLALQRIRMSQDLMKSLWSMALLEAELSNQWTTQFKQIPSNLQIEFKCKTLLEINKLWAMKNLLKHKTGGLISHWKANKGCLTTNWRAKLDPDTLLARAIMLLAHDSGITLSWKSHQRNSLTTIQAFKYQIRL